MKSQRLSTFARIALAATTAGVMTACVAVRDGYRDDYEPAPYYSPQAGYYDYWYYPAIGAYYEPRTRVYLYFDRDHWIHARELPSRVERYRGDHVTIRLPNDRPYEQQNQHRRQYEPERYKKHDHGRNDSDNDTWIGAPGRQR